ncbi:MAG: hypothetical protein AB7F28_04185 [Candidatus Margulisiibacteriota bacterium]
MFFQTKIIALGPSKEPDPHLRHYFEIVAQLASYPETLDPALQQKWVQFFVTYGYRNSVALDRGLVDNEALSPWVPRIANAALRPIYARTAQRQLPLVHRLEEAYNCGPYALFLRQDPSAVLAQHFEICPLSAPVDTLDPDLEPRKILWILPEKDAGTADSVALHRNHLMITLLPIEKRTLLIAHPHPQDPEGCKNTLFDILSHRGLVAMPIELADFVFAHGKTLRGSLALLHPDVQPSPVPVKPDLTPLIHAKLQSLTCPSIDYLLVALRNSLGPLLDLAANDTLARIDRTCEELENRIDRFKENPTRTTFQELIQPCHRLLGEVYGLLLLQPRYRVNNDFTAAYCHATGLSAQMPTEATVFASGMAAESGILLAAKALAPDRPLQVGYQDNMYYESGLYASTLHSEAATVFNIPSQPPSHALDLLFAYFHSPVSDTDTHYPPPADLIKLILDHCPPDRKKPLMVAIDTTFNRLNDPLVQALFRHPDIQQRLNAGQLLLITYGSAQKFFEFGWDSVAGGYCSWTGDPGVFATVIGKLKAPENVCDPSFQFFTHLLTHCPKALDEYHHRLSENALLLRETLQTNEVLSVLPSDDESLNYVSVRPSDLLTLDMRNLWSHSFRAGFGFPWTTLTFIRWLNFIRISAGSEPETIIKQWAADFNQVAQTLLESLNTQAKADYATLSIAATPFLNEQTFIALRLSPKTLNKNPMLATQIIQWLANALETHTTLVLNLLKDFLPHIQPNEALQPLLIQMTETQAIKTQLKTPPVENVLRQFRRLCPEIRLLSLTHCASAPIPGHQCLNHHSSTHSLNITPSGTTNHPSGT